MVGPARPITANSESDPLPTASSEELLQALLGDDASLRPVKQLLTERAQGNPFFLEEESVRTLIESNVLMGERGNYRSTKPIDRTLVPTTVQAILAARMDRLSPEEKSLLQSAAVVGKDVPLGLLQAVADRLEEDLRRGLTRLQAAEFLDEYALFPEPEYTFKHALTHEVAYRSLLQERRRALHQRIVDAIRSIVFRPATRAFRAACATCRWSRALAQSGGIPSRGWKTAAGYSATRDAISYFEQALDALNHHPEDRRSAEKAIDIRLDLGPALIARSGFSASEVEENYTRARVLCEVGATRPSYFRCYGDSHGCTIRAAS